ncbi:MAG: hypothetical protein Q8P08_00805 [bacterium]|nr:hypothetical protein [bacterium]
MDILKKIQQKPEGTRKVILWLIVVIVGIFLLFWWWSDFQRKTKEFNLEELKEGFGSPSSEMEELLKANE